MNAFLVFAIGDIHQMALMRDDPLRHRLNCQHVVDKACVGRAFRHSGHCVTVIFGLGKCEAAMLLDRRQSNRAVTAGARKDDADCILTLIFGQ